MNKMKKFILEKNENKKTIYLTENAQVGTDYDRETKDWQSYHGREILELLQNADDEIDKKASSEYKKVEISFKKDVLTISNYGSPFTEDGIISLMYSNNSSKRERQKEVIGNKGTGFRSVLNWANEITIHSGDLHVRFSEDYAKSVMNDILSKYKEPVKNKKAPTLAFPEWIGEKKASEYTTTISLKVKKGKHKEIINQIKNLDENILLFLNRTEILSIDTDEYSVVYSKKKKKNSVVLSKTVNNCIVSEKEWHVRTKTGTTIDNLDTDDNGKPKEKAYIISLAYCDQGIDEDEQFLYSYFKTDVVFPYPFLLHASFSLDQNRNHLAKDSDANKTILKAAAGFMVDIAIKIAQKKRADYEICKLLINDSKLPVDLSKDYKFEDYLLDSATKKPILPNVNGKYIPMTYQPVWYNTGLSKYLRGKDFDRVLLDFDTEEEEDLSSFIYDLFPVDPDDYKFSFESACKIVKAWVKRQNVKTDNIEGNKEKIRHIARTAKAFKDEFSWNINKKANPNDMPAFFFNEDYELIPFGTPIFFLDEGLSISKPPEFVKVEFLNSFMREYLLRNIFDDKDEALKYFDALGIKEYNSDEIIELLNITISSKKKTKPYWDKIIKWLWDNRDIVLSDDSTTIDVLFYTRKKTYKKSSTLYLGKEYGYDLCDNLLGKVGSADFAADIHEIIGNQPTELINEFLEKLGIDSLPRLIKESVSIHNSWWYGGKDRDFICKLVEELKYPYKIGNDSYKTSSAFSKAIKEVEYERSSIENLEKILKTSKTTDIIEWIRNDDSLRSMLTTKHEATTSSVNVLWGNKINRFQRIDEIKKPYSYIYYLFCTVPWIQVDDKRYNIDDCLILNNNCNLAPHLVSPDIDDYIKNIDENKSTVRKEYKRIFKDLGVKEGLNEFDDLPVSKIYSVLMHLCEIEESSSIAKSLYSCLLEKDFDSKTIECDERKAFLEQGMVYTNNGYKPIKETYYLAEKGISRQVLNNFNTICLDTRESVAKVQKVFGVKELRIHGEPVGEPTLHNDSSTFGRDFKEFLPLCFVYRLKDLSSKTDIRDEARKMLSINICLCSEITALYNSEFQVRLDDYEYIVCEKRKAYIKVPYDFSLNLMKHNQKFSFAIAEVICSCLDIAKPLKDIANLFFRGSQSERLEYLYSTESEHLVQEALGYFDIKEDIKDEFIHTVSKITKNDKKYIRQLSHNIDFDHFSGKGNASVLIELFKKLEIDFDDYNSCNVSSEIDLTSYFQSEIERIKQDYRELYKSIIYKKLKTKSIDEKKRLVDCFFDFDNADYIIHNSAYFNAEEVVFKRFSLNKPEKQMDLNKIYKTNKEKWTSSIKEGLNLIDSFLSNNENTSLLYYAEFEELGRRFEEYLSSYNDETADTSLIESPHKELRVVKNFSIKPATFSNVKPNNNTVGFKNNESKASQVRNGKNGERYVYDLLKKHHKVYWISENAKKENINPEGRAGLGYDMEYIDENNNRFFVEVKTSAKSINDGIKFYLSNNEYDFAVAHQGKYFIYYVTDVNSDNPQLYILTDVIFDDFNKEKYTVETESKYIITAKVD